jgi:UDP-N-acetylmuramoylalanine--D-glutamate ligase
MIVSQAFRGKRYAVLGLARTGLATARSLVASGATVVAWDQQADARAFVGDDIELADPMEMDLAGFDGIIVSPGVPINTHPLSAKAYQAHVALIGDIELFAMARAELPAHKIVAITGTNGKSTTTALIHHIVKAAGIPTLMGGNIGLPILGQEPLPEGGVYVLELSSFQIDLTYSLAADIAVLTNVTPDHLDRYDGFAGYMASKERLFTLQHADNTAVIACDDDPSKIIASRVNHRLIRLSAKDIMDQSRWPALQGPHNAQNAACAIAVCQVLGIDDAVIERALQSFGGLPHRMERIGEFNGVLYVNDSKATNSTSTAPALAAYPGVHWIVGGISKTPDLDACLPYLSNVRFAYTIGRDGEMLGKWLSEHGVTVIAAGTIERALEKAADILRSGETVLLSPACASQDQFRDFEERGDCFRAAVLAKRGSA